MSPCVCKHRKGFGQLLPLCPSFLLSELNQKKGHGLDKATFSFWTMEKKKFEEEGFFEEEMVICSVCACVLAL